jgi:NRF-like protein
VVDSWGKGLEGLLRGHVNALGDFDECTGTIAENFKGQYCTVYLHIRDSSIPANYTPHKGDRSVLAVLVSFSVEKLWQIFPWGKVGNESIFIL